MASKVSPKVQRGQHDARYLIDVSGMYSGSDVNIRGLSLVSHATPDATPDVDIATLRAVGRFLDVDSIKSIVLRDKSKPEASQVIGRLVFIARGRKVGVTDYRSDPDGDQMTPVDLANGYKSTLIKPDDDAAKDFTPDGKLPSNVTAVKWTSDGSGHKKDELKGYRVVSDGSNGSTVDRDGGILIESMTRYLFNTILAGVWSTRRVGRTKLLENALDEKRAQLESLIKMLVAAGQDVATIAAAVGMDVAAVNHILTPDPVLAEGSTGEIDPDDDDDNGVDPA